MRNIKTRTLTLEERSYGVGDRTMLGVFALILMFFFVAIMYPLIYAAISSFTKGILPLNLVPKLFTLEGYKACFNYPLLWSGFKNSCLYTCLGTIIALVVTICCAYPLSIKNLPGSGFMLFICMFTMYFDGGLIPTFLWIKKTGLYNTMWAVILPSALSIFNMLVMRTYFSNSIPFDLKEAADLDGASEITYLLRIVIPLSGPVIAVIALYYASALWNSYFNAMMYLLDLKKMPLANILRNLLITSQNAGSSAATDSMTAAAMEERQDVMKYCVMVIATVPMMVIYPFIQKFFVKGVMIGAVKG
jgi:putative aldouronate transport system permease protein